MTQQTVPQVSRDAPRRRARWGWMLLLSVAGATAATWATIAWLLTEADRATGAQRIDARFHAIQLGLFVAACAVGVIALLLAARRQWLSERAQSHREDTARLEHGHRERLADDARHDAVERRITDQYLTTADQLGSAKAPVRLAGLYALERLAGEHQHHRQTIVDVICAYLRMPYSAPGPRNDGSAIDADAGQERQVRITAQRILAGHLRATVVGAGGDEESDPQRWEDVVLDLAGATLIDFDFRRCEVRQANFTGARFTGRTSFQQASFHSAAWFGEAVFSGTAAFHDATFHSGAWFRESTFHATAGFGKVVFAGPGDAVFERTSFLGYADFGAVTVHSNAAFLHARFGRGANFRDATFYRAAHFAGATVAGRGDLEQAVFTGASFFGAAFFGGATFQTDVTFDGAKFLAGADFTTAAIDGRARFDSVAAMPDNGSLRFAGVSVRPAPNGHVWPQGWRAEAHADGTSTLAFALAWDGPTPAAPQMPVPALPEPIPVLAEPIPALPEAAAEPVLAVAEAPAEPVQAVREAPAEPVQAVREAPAEDEGASEESPEPDSGPRPRAVVPVTPAPGDAHADASILPGGLNGFSRAGGSHGRAASA